MQQQERINDFEHALRVAMKAFAVRLHCAAIGIVESFDGKDTVQVTLAIQGIVRKRDGTKSLVTVNPLVGVPVVFMGGGGMVTTYPISKGDEALVIFADRCIDSWLQSGGVQVAADPRVHHLADGIAIVGPRSMARLIPNISATSAQFRSLDGSTYFEVAPDGKANVVAPGGITLTGPVTVDGTLSVTDKVTGSADFSITGKVDATGEGTFNGIAVSTHVHGGVQSGGSTTGTPVP